MTAKDDRKNAEGYNDPTAYNAIKNVERKWARMMRDFISY